MGYGSMADDYRNEIYLSLLDRLGPVQSLILIEKLMIDVKNTRRGLQAAQSAKAADLLNEPSHVLISLAAVVGAVKLHHIAKEINEFKSLAENDFPSNTVKSAVHLLDHWLQFLKSDKAARGRMV